MVKEKATDKKQDQAADTEAAVTDAKKTLQGKEASAKTQPPIQQGMMRIKVYSPYQVYFDDFGKSISAINDTGPFDILPKHHRFLTLLIPCELSIVTDAGEERIKISRGIMYVKEDRVTVFLDV